MDFDPKDDRKSDRSYIYTSDDYYYSTDGRYHPPRRPRNYGWMVAVLGAFLLCVAGGVALSRDSGTVSQTQTMQQETESDVDSSETAATETLGAEEAGTFLAVADDSAQEEPDEDDAAEEEPDEDSRLRLEISDTSEETMRLQDIYKKVIVSVASITAMSSSSVSTGTGIIMSEDGYIITNNHVISGAQSVLVLLYSGDEYEASVVGGDETSDLAVLKIEAEGLTPAEFGSSDNLEVGDAVVAIGDPLGTELRGTMTDGIICGLSRDVQVEDRTLTLIQTNAALNSGNSGGPLVNMSGQVIGINTMKLSSSYTSVEGIGFAIPISTAKDIVDELIEKGYVSGRPAFGFDVEVLSTQMKLFYNLPSVLFIDQVQEGSSAYENGIRNGDLIMAINGTSVSTLDEFNTIKNQFEAGDTVTLRIYRKGMEADVDVQLLDQADVQ